MPSSFAKVQRHLDAAIKEINSANEVLSEDVKALSRPLVYVFGYLSASRDILKSAKEAVVTAGTNKPGSEDEEP